MKRGLLSIFNYLCSSSKGLWHQLQPSWLPQIRAPFQAHICVSHSCHSGWASNPIHILEPHRNPIEFLDIHRYPGYCLGFHQAALLPTKNQPSANRCTAVACPNPSPCIGRFVSDHQLYAFIELSKLWTSHEWWKKFLGASHTISWH